MDIKISSDGEKNALVILSGFLGQDLPVREILSFKHLKKSPSKVRIEGAFWLIQEKLGFNLWWWGSEPQLAFPMESRNYVDFTKFEFLHAPSGATGLGLSSFNAPKKPEPEKSFLIMLDLVKQ